MAETPCDCHLHPDHPTRCDPFRGGFNCAGQYRMPTLPAGMVCQNFQAPLIHFPELTQAEKDARVMKVDVFLPGANEETH